MGLETLHINLIAAVWFMLKTPNYLRIMPNRARVKKSACVRRALSAKTSTAKNAGHAKKPKPEMAGLSLHGFINPGLQPGEKSPRERPPQLSEKDSKLGGVETHADARKCAALFRKHRITSPVQVVAASR